MTAGSEQVTTAPAAEAAAPTSGLVTSTGAQLLAAFPPRPIGSPWPATEASRSAVLARVLGGWCLTRPFLAETQTRQIARL